jgi:hypothetical protein
MRMYSNVQKSKCLLPGSTLLLSLSILCGCTTTKEIEQTRMAIRAAMKGA